LGDVSMPIVRIKMIFKSRGDAILLNSETKVYAMRKQCRVEIRRKK
jgi:hypothetical protein